MTAALEEDEWSAVRPGRTLPPGKTRYPLYRRLGGPQGQSGRAENLVPTGIRSRTIQHVVSRYTDWANRPTPRSLTSLFMPESIWRSHWRRDKFLLYAYLGVQTICVGAIWGKYALCSDRFCTIRNSNISIINSKQGYEWVMHVAMIVKKLLHYRGADKSLSGQEGNKLRLSQFVMGRGMVRFG